MRVSLPIYEGEDVPPRKQMRLDVVRRFRELGDGEGPEVVVPAVVGFAQAAEDQVIASAWKVAARTPACAKGCGYCCHLQVASTVPEVLVAIRFARQTYDEDALAALRLRSRAGAEAAKGRAPRSYGDIACAFLVDGACSVYGARPLACRAWHSFDVSTCIQGFETGEGQTEVEEIVYRNAKGSQLGYREGLRHAGYDDAPYDFKVATDIALSDPSAEARWLAGDPSAFAAARIHDDLEPR